MQHHPVLQALRQNKLSLLTCTGVHFSASKFRSECERCGCGMQANSAYAVMVSRVAVAVWAIITGIAMCTT